MSRRNKNVINNRREISSQQRMMRRGQTIVAEREQMISESERMNMRKKAKQKRVTWALVIIAIGIVVVVLMVVMGRNLYREIEAGKDEPVKTYEPTVTIEDEGGSGLVTARMKEYVGMLEEDFLAGGHKVVRAVVPAGKTREVDIYLEGRGEYYKTNIDRGTGVTVEDAERMMKYLDERGITPGYVDVRVAGRGYYR